MSDSKWTMSISDISDYIHTPSHSELRMGYEYWLNRLDKWVQYKGRNLKVLNVECIDSVARNFISEKLSFDFFDKTRFGNFSFILSIIWDSLLLSLGVRRIAGYIVRFEDEDGNRHTLKRVKGSSYFKPNVRTL